MTVIGIDEGLRRKWLHAHIASPCPNCGCCQWGMTEEVIVPMITRQGEHSIVQDKALCLLPAVCTSCQYVAMYAMHDDDRKMTTVPKLSEAAQKTRDRKDGILFAAAQMNGFLLALGAMDLIVLVVIIAHFLIQRFH